MEMKCVSSSRSCRGTPTVAELPRCLRPVLATLTDHVSLDRPSTQLDLTITRWYSGPQLYAQPRNVLACKVDAVFINNKDLCHPRPPMKVGYHTGHEIQNADARKIQNYLGVRDPAVSLDTSRDCRYGEKNKRIYSLAAVYAAVW